MIIILLNTDEQTTKFVISTKQCTEVLKTENKCQHFSSNSEPQRLLCVNMLPAAINSLMCFCFTIAVCVAIDA